MCVYVRRQCSSVYDSAQVPIQPATNRLMLSAVFELLGLIYRHRNYVIMSRSCDRQTTVSCDVQVSLYSSVYVYVCMYVF